MSAITSFNQSLSRRSGAVPVILRLTLGVVMLAHGWQKITAMGPENFGNTMLAGLGVPLPVATGFVVSYIELIGGALLVVGLLSRVSAALIAVILAGATILVKTDLGLIAEMGSALPGAELDLALIALSVAVVLAGPGKLSLDRMLGLETVATDPLGTDVIQVTSPRETSAA